MHDLVVHVGRMRVESSVKRVRSYVAPRRLSSLGRTQPETLGDRQGCEPTRQGDRWRLRAIDAQDGVRFLDAVKEGFQQGAHGSETIGIKQGAHALP